MPAKKKDKKKKDKKKDKTVSPRSVDDVDLEMDGEAATLLAEAMESFRATAPAAATAVSDSADGSRVPEPVLENDEAQQHSGDDSNTLVPLTLNLTSGSSLTLQLTVPT